MGKFPNGVTFRGILGGLGRGRGVAAVYFVVFCVYVWVWGGGGGGGGVKRVKGGFSIERFYKKWLVCDLRDRQGLGKNRYRFRTETFNCSNCFLDFHGRFVDILPSIGQKKQPSFNPPPPTPPRLPKKVD